MSLSRKNVPPAVLIFDHDDTIAIPARDKNGQYVVSPDGAIASSVMNKEKLQKIVIISQLVDIPIHIVTARASTAPDREVVEQTVNAVNGFTEPNGGFNKDHIHFSGIIIEGRWQQVCTKVSIIEAIHSTFYTALPKKSLLFVDDMKGYLDPVEKAGFSTILANPTTQTHFDLVLDFIFRNLRNAYVPTLFKPDYSLVSKEAAFSGVTYAASAKEESKKLTK